MRETLKKFSRRPNTQVAVSLGGGSVLLIGEPDRIAEEWRSMNRDEEDPPCRTQGLVQLRVVNLDEDVDTQETSCYVHEGLPWTHVACCFKSQRLDQLVEKYINWKENDA
ncbi:uncharacterized protein LOC105188491 [Harpegnathos saltator]|uniref:uncharacterized protein LOC105188491 n=1 Tax=Harpegnathos saltator TaxID=610380 RepID=UPI00058ED954|nr:uncharacterized protein LOC105188491 [Harpegnathos saltator]